MARYVAQFPHPGPERLPGRREWKSGVRELPWNVGGHGRKFVSAAGLASPDGETFRRGMYELWCEWEPPSRVAREFHAPIVGFPAALQAPFVIPNPTGAHQNTDPLVFGDRFHYSNCMQYKRGARNPKLRAMDPASLILFGSKVAGEWVVDTVFVVAESKPMVPKLVDDPIGLVDRVIRTPLAAEDGKPNDREYTLYSGATPDAPVDGMFSFVPCIPHPSAEGFRRPRIDDKLSWTLRTITQSVRAIDVESANAPDPRSVWGQVRDLVLSDPQGLMLGTRFESPGLADAAHASTNSPIGRTC